MKKQLKFKKIDFYLIDALFGESWEKNLFFKKNVYLRLMKNKIPIPLFCSHYSGYFQIYCIFCNSIYDILAIPLLFDDILCFCWLLCVKLPSSQLSKGYVYLIFANYNPLIAETAV